MEFITAINIVYAVIALSSIASLILVGCLLVTWGEIRGENRTWNEISDHFGSGRIEIGRELN